MIMSSPLKERALVDIRATAEAHSDIADDLLAIHGLSGADTVASLHDIGKAYGSNGGNVGADPRNLVAIFGPPMEL